MKTNKELKIKKGYYSAFPDALVTVPKGSPVQKKETLSGTHGRQIEYFVNPSVFSGIDKHDAIHYGFRVAKEDIEF